MNSLSADLARELLPCPFCGAEFGAVMYPPTCTKDDKYNAADRAFPIVRCECGVQCWGKDWDKSGKSAIAAWNTRPEIAAQSERIAAFERQFAENELQREHLMERAEAAEQALRVAEGKIQAAIDALPTWRYCSHGMQKVPDDEPRGYLKLKDVRAAISAEGADNG